MKKFNIAMIGCGRISMAYRCAFESLKDRVNVKYAVDVDFDKAKSFASGFKGCTAMTDYKAILTQDIDVIHIGTPHHLHMEIAISAMSKGIHVLVEKPMAINLKDADSMIKSAKDNNVKLGVIFQTRFTPGFIKLKNMIRNKELGEIKAARSYLSWSRSDDYYRESEWKGTWDKEGGGVLIDQAIHSIDRVQNLIGDEVQWVEGSMSNRNHKAVLVEDVAEAFIQFKKGCLYQVYACNCYCCDAPIQIEIVGEKGKAGLIQDKAWIHLQSGVYTELESEDLKKDLQTPDYWGSGHLSQIIDFYHGIDVGEEIQVDGQEGRKALEIVKAIYHSALSGSKIVLPFEDKLINIGEN